MVGRGRAVCGPEKRTSGEKSPSVAPPATAPLPLVRSQFIRLDVTNDESGRLVMAGAVVGFGFGLGFLAAQVGLATVPRHGQQESVDVDGLLEDLGRADGAGD